ncbi:unnamed protein product [Schistocephalus solidus]|uniref:Uncharacterized protein n=1 Tax=Schistocephalus solidus TaxID=70667 RepID=A0A183T3J5_SCHSO|nr:unnamed protein product [Schistocephalus solidus]
MCGSNEGKIGREGLSLRGSAAGTGSRAHGRNIGSVDECTKFADIAVDSAFVDAHATEQVHAMREYAWTVRALEAAVSVVAAPLQLHLPQHGVDAEDSGPLQDFRVRDPVLPSQLLYSAEAAEMEVIQVPGLVRVYGPGLCSVKECRQDDGLIYLQFGVQVNTVVITHEGLQPVECLTGFGNPLSNLFDSRVV